MLSIFVEGILIFDPSGRLDELKQLALQLWKKGRPGQSLEYPFLEKMRHVPYDLLDDAHDLIEKDPASALYIMHHALSVVIDLHYRLSRKWQVKLKYTIEDLRHHSPKFAEKVVEFLSEKSPIKKKFEILSELITETVAPIGGRMSEWSSPWELLGPDGKWKVQR